MMRASSLGTDVVRARLWVYEGLGGDSSNGRSTRPSSRPAGATDQPQWGDAQLCVGGALDGGKGAILCFEVKEADAHGDEVAVASGCTIVTNAQLMAPVGAEALLAHKALPGTQAPLGEDVEVRLNPPAARLHFTLRPAVAVPLSPSQLRQKSCSRECARNTLPQLPILTPHNEREYPAWHAYIRAVYKQSLAHAPPGRTIDLNSFSLFYRQKVGVSEPRLGDPVADLLSGGIDPCLTRVCTLRSWPNRPRAYDGTPFVGDSGPEQGVGKLPAFFVHRPPLTKMQVERCDFLEVMHVKTDWLGGERGVSWFFHSVGSGVFLDCKRLPTAGKIVAYTDRNEWVQWHSGQDWGSEGDKHVLEVMERERVAMLAFTAAGFTYFGDAGRNPSTEFVVRHRNAESTELNSPKGSCLNEDPQVGIRLVTGLNRSVRCRCVSRRDPIASINCDDTLPEAIDAHRRTASPQA